MNNLCGWNTTSQYSHFDQSNLIVIPPSNSLKPIYQPNTTIKLSVKNPENPSYDQNHLITQFNPQSIAHNQFQPSYSINSTQTTNICSNVHQKQFPIKYPTNLPLK